jgi:hypothetical protein
MLHLKPMSCKACPEHDHTEFSLLLGAVTAEHFQVDNNKSQVHFEKIV